MTSLTTPKETGRGADIPAPRGGQGVRLLVLGVDEDARLLREQAVAAGYELAQRYSARVSHVAYGAGVDPADGRYAKIRDAGLALQPIAVCATQLGLAPAPTVPGPTKGESGGGGAAKPAAGSEPASASLPAPASGKAEPEPEPASPESEAGPREAEREPEADDVPDDDLLDEPGGPDPLAYPPLPEEEPEPDEPAKYAYEDAHTGTDTVAFIEPTPEPDADEPEPDEEPDDEDEAENAVRLAGAMIGADPWLGEAGDARASAAMANTHESEAVEVAGKQGFGFAFELDELDDLDAVDELEALGDAEVLGTADAASPAARPGPRRLVFSFIWALIPLVSLGLLTPVVFGYAAVRTRSRLYAAATLGYALAVVLAFALSATHPQTGSSAHGSDGVLTFALALSWLGGTGHALSARPRVFGARQRTAEH